MWYEGSIRSSISIEVWQQIKAGYAAGIGLREIARNMNVPEDTVLARAKREGWTQQIAAAKQAIAPMQSNAITPLQSVAITMQQRAERHIYRMAGVTEKVLPRLESMNAESILDRVHDIENYDRLARRNYGLSDNQDGSGSLNLNVLAGRGRTLIAIESQSDVVNTTSTPGSLRGKTSSVRVTPGAHRSKYGYDNKIEYRGRRIDRRDHSSNLRRHFRTGGQTTRLGTRAVTFLPGRASDADRDGCRKE